MKNLLLRHALGLLVILLLAGLYWTTQYFFTYLGPNATDEADKGRYLLGLTVCLVQAAFLVLGIFAPASFFSLFLSATFKVRPIYLLPVGIVTAFLLDYLWYALFIANFTTSALLMWPLALKSFCIFLLAPFCLYWWLTLPRGLSSPSAKP